MYSTAKERKELIEKLKEAKTKKDIQKICFSGLAKSFKNESGNKKQDMISELMDSIGLYGIF